MTAAGQGRMAAVLFTDLVGSTELLSRLGEAAFEGLRRAHFAALRGAIGQSRGAEVKTTGDGLLAVFSSAAAAVDCAVAIQQAVDLHARAGAPVAVRVGVAVGDVSFEDGDVFGAPLAEAARLVAAARGGQILTTAVVRAVAGGRSLAHFTDVGSMELRGFPAPVAACEVAWEPAPAISAVPLPARLAGPHQAGFVGRTPEREALDQCLANAANGERRVLLLAGEPGIGKTRLCAEAAAGARERGVAVLYGRCDEGLSLPYQPWAEALRHVIAHVPAYLLRAHVAQHGGELVRLVPELGRRVADLPNPRTSDPETERYLLWGAATGLLAEVAAETPVMVVLDDLQWADLPTLQLLRHLAGLDGPSRLLVIGTYRDSDLGADHPLHDTLATLRREPGVERIRLSGLAEAEVVGLMSELAGHEMDAAGLALAAALWGETDGNPFFTGELLRHLAEIGAIRQGEDGRWETSADLDPVSLPASVREVIGQRVRRLGEGTAGLLGVAAVIGQTFELNLISAVSGADEDAVLELLEAASRAAIVAEQTWSPGRFSFAHALIQRSLYADLSMTRRQRLHRRVAEALEAICRDDPGERVGELAHHWGAAVTQVEAAKALHYAIRAAERALQLLASDEAVRWYRMALELLAANPPVDERARCRLLIGLGAAQRQAGNPEHQGTLLEAAQHAQVLGDTELLVRAALANDRGVWAKSGEVDVDRVAVLEMALAAVPIEDTLTRARLLTALSSELAYEPDHVRRRAIAEQAIAVARRSGDAAAVVNALSRPMHTLHVPDAVAERLVQTAEAVRLASSLDDPGARFWAAYARLYPSMQLGDVDDFDRCLANLTAIARAVGQPMLSWAAVCPQPWRLMLAGDAVSAERAAEQALQLGGESGQQDAFLIYGAQLMIIRWHQGRLGELVPMLEQLMAATPSVPGFTAALAWAHAEGGDLDAAQRLVDGARAMPFELPYDVVWLYGTSIWAEVASQLGDALAADQLYDRLTPWHRQVVFAGVTGLGAVAHHIGQLAAVLGRTREAVAHFSEALAIHESLRAPFHIARTKLEWGRLLLEHDRAGATELLSAACELAEQHGCVRVEGLAREALGQASPR